MESQPTPHDSSGKLSTEESVELAAQVAELARAGLPLAGGLRALADELPAGRLPGLLRRMSRRLESGATLEEAICAEGSALPAHVRGLVVAAVRSGRLAETLEEFVDLERTRLELRRRVWSILAYPLVLLAILSGLSLLLQGYIAPQFAEIFEDFGLELPVLTRLFLHSAGLGTWLVEVAVSMAIAVLLLSWAMPRIPWAPRVFYWVPLIGPLWRWSRLARFSRLTALLLDQQIPLPEALRLAAGGLREADLAAGCRRVAEQVEQGRPLAEALASRRQFPPSMIPLVEWGQRSSAPADAFRAAAEMFEGRVRTQGRFLEVVTAPLTFLLILTFIMAFLLAMFMPLIALIQKLT